MNAISGFGKGTEDKPFSNEYQGVRIVHFELEKQSPSRPLLERFSVNVILINVIDIRHLTLLRIYVGISAAATYREYNGISLTGNGRCITKIKKPNGGSLTDEQRLYN